MSTRKRLIGAVTAVVSIVAVCGQTAQAAQLRVTNVAAVGDGFVQFDITWTNSWRASWKEAGADLTNWDAAWVFVKYRRKARTAWSHATLSPKDADHTAPKGAEINVGLTGNRGVGVFLHRSDEGKGTWTNKGVKLKWLNKIDRVSDTDKVELFVHALEMVYVPKGGFYVGGAGKLAGSFTDGAWKKGDDVIPFKIISESELKIAPKAGCLYGTGGKGAAHQIGPIGKLPAKFPKGYGAFYCMKYEINQREYAAFLSQLTAAQAAKRYPLPTIPARFANKGVHTVKKTSSGYSATKPERACNWVSWDDCAAYLDWAGLRPMTELEFEKACRGPLKSTENEYAWGNGTLSEASWIFEPDTAPPIPHPQGICGKGGRIKAGCTYWGIAAMSGHLRERTVTAGHIEGRAFTGLCGDGALGKNGLADVPGWPGPTTSWPDSSTAGAGFSGGPWYLDPARLRVSDRFLSSCLRRQRDRSYGFRAVRHEPCATPQTKKIDPDGDKPDSTDNGKTRRAEFGGVRGNGHHIVYLIDRSGSMFDTLPAVKRKIIASVKDLKPDQDFHVLMFSNGQPLEKRPMALTPANIENELALIGFLNKVKAEGTTNPVKAIQRAFDVLARANKRPGKVMYFLTDGAFPDNEAVMAVMRMRNKRRDVTVNTFLYGWKPDLAVKVMTKIARESGGRYRYIDPDE